MNNIIIFMYELLFLVFFIYTYDFFKHLLQFIVHFIFVLIYILDKFFCLFVK